MRFCKRFRCVFPSNRRSFNDWNRRISRMVSRGNAASGLEQPRHRRRDRQNTGAPNDGFLWNICSEKQNLPRIFYSLRKAKNFWMTVPFMYNFRTLSNKFPMIFWSLIFPISLASQIKLFFRRKRKTWNVRNGKCDAERNQKNSPFRKTFNCS